MPSLFWFGKAMNKKSPDLLALLPISCSLNLNFNDFKRVKETGGNETSCWSGQTVSETIHFWTRDGNFLDDYLLRTMLEFIVKIKNWQFLLNLQKARGFRGDRTLDLLLTRETLLPLSHEARLREGRKSNYIIINIKEALYVRKQL